jgi:hypothetical protein
LHEGSTGGVVQVDNIANYTDAAHGTNVPGFGFETYRQAFKK